MQQCWCSLHLNIYNIASSNIVFGDIIGLGLYHTGIEMVVRDGYSTDEDDDMPVPVTFEYSFSHAGILRTHPRLPNFGVLRESLHMGTILSSALKLDTFIKSFGGSQFYPGAYHLLHNNCNHFSDAVCFVLTGNHVPDWVNRVAGLFSNAFPHMVVSDEDITLSTESVASDEATTVSAESAVPSVTFQDFVDHIDGPAAWGFSVPFVPLINEFPGILVTPFVVFGSSSEHDKDERSALANN
jgi:hypothetical protein